MNIHVAQTLEAIAEEMHIMLLNYNIITPQSARPCLGFVQDCMSSMYELSQDDVAFEPATAMQLYARIEKPTRPFPTPMDGRVTGKALFSCLLPPTLNAKFGNVIIENGILVTGLLTSKVLGPTPGGLIHILARYPTQQQQWSISDSLEATQQFISDGQRLGLAYFEKRGFSVGIGDILMPKEIRAKIETLVDANLAKAKAVFQDTKPQTETEESQCEMNVLTHLQEGSSLAGAEAMTFIKPQLDTSGHSSVALRNNIHTMMTAGSKGKPSNVMQMSACVGQQVIAGKRPTLAFGISGRSLPHFTAQESRNDPQCRGFIKSSYTTGLTPVEFFASQQGGREGMTDTSVKSVTGDTRLFIIENGRSKCVTIGNWIDEQMAQHAESIDKSQPLNTEVLGVQTSCQIPTVDDKGHVFLSELTKICRHDSDGVLYHVVTASGRKVTVPGSKALVVWVNDKLCPISVNDAKIGDLVPITYRMDLDDKYIIDAFIGENHVDQFHLGKFIGLFLSAGNSRIDTGVVSITHNDPEVQEFIASWFDQLGVKHKMLESNVIAGDSSSLAKWLSDYIGYETAQKRIPDFAYAAPVTFIRGLLNGYYSGDVQSSIDKGTITSSSASEILTEGIISLLTRLSIFGKLGTCQTQPKPSYWLYISGEDAVRFANQVPLMLASKQNALDRIASSCTSVHLKHREKDVCLDKIVSITQIHSTEKLYDVTVPSTFNFCLHNGLGVRDTQESGYFTRKLTKNLENISIEYDGTVRSGGGVDAQLIQFTYGDDGFDPMYLEHQTIDIYSTTDEEIYTAKFAGIGEEDEQETLLRWYDATCRARSSLLDIFPNREFGKWYLPVRVHHFMDVRRGPKHIKNAVDWLLQYEHIKQLLHRLSVQVGHNPQHIVFESLVWDGLCPKNIVEHNLNNDDMQWVLDSVEHMWHTSRITPGEKVGIIASQSLGQLAMQATLNSVAGSTELLLRNEDQYERVTIGDFIDKFMGDSVDYVEMYPNDTEYLALPNRSLQILAADQNGIVSWQTITALTRHPVLTKKLLRVKLESGRVLLGTAAKSFVTINPQDNELVPTEGSDLKVGDLIPVSINNPHVIKDTIELRDYLPPSMDISLTNYVIPEVISLDMNFGWLCGMYVAEGSLCGQLSTIEIAASHDDLQQNIIRIGNLWKIKGAISGPGNGTGVTLSCRIIAELFLRLFGKRAASKRVHPSLFGAPTEWVKGFISGYIDGDGCISGNRIICASISDGLLRDIQHLATRFNVTATFGLQPPKETTMKNGSTIRTSTTHRLVWGVREATALRDNLSLVREHKRNALAKINDKHAHLAGPKPLIIKDVIADKIKDIEVVPWHEKVYDLTVEGFKTFNALNGCVFMDTFHLSGIGNSAVTTGFPRLRALVNVSSTKDANVLRLSLTAPNNRDESLAIKIAKQLKYTTLEDVIVGKEGAKMKSVHYGIPEEDKTWFNFWRTIYDGTFKSETFSQFANDVLSETSRYYYSFVGRLLLDGALLRTFVENDKGDYSIGSICSLIQSQFENVIAIPSPDCMENPVILLFIHDNMTPDDSGDLCPDVAMETILNELPECIHVHGVHGIEEVFVKGGPNAGGDRTHDILIQRGICQADEFYIETSGGSLNECALIEGIDYTRSISNSPLYMQAVLGIEASRQTLQSELVKVLADTSHVDSHHISLVIDWMTQTGKLCPITRHTQNKMKHSGVLDRSTNEEGISVLVDGAINARRDNLSGVSSRVACGKLVEAGTGIMGLYIDANMLLSSRVYERPDNDDDFGLSALTLHDNANIMDEEDDDEAEFHPAY